jgi:uncharacterized membrane protein required for colicin V production
MIDYLLICVAVVAFLWGIVKGILTTVGIIVAIALMIQLLEALNNK